MREVRIVLRNTSPFLIDAMSRTTLLKLRTKTKTNVAAGDIPAPEVEALGKLYLDPGDERYTGIPVDNLYSCLVAAGQSDECKIGKRKVSTAEKTELNTIIPEFRIAFIRFSDYQGNPYIVEAAEGERRQLPAGIKVDIRRGIGKQAQVPTAVAITRPIFNEVQFEVVCVFNNDRYSDRLLYNLFKEAGLNCGIGGFRPNKGRGRFGRFKMMEFSQKDIEVPKDEVILTLNGQPYQFGEEAKAATPKRKAKEAA